MVAIEPFYVAPAIHRFGPADEAQLEICLVGSDKNTRLQALHHTRDLQLLPDARTSDGYSLTEDAFRQVSRELAVGLAGFIADISGTTLRSGHADVFNRALAVQVFNLALNLRFSNLRGRRLLCNDQDKRIEGLIGPRHAFLENRAFYHRVREAMQESQSPMLFSGALMIGRRLSLRYRGAAPRATYPLDGKQFPIYRGFYFINGEVGGFSARAARAVFGPFGWCLSAINSAEGGKVHHAGRDFEQRLELLLQAVVARPDDVPGTRRQLLALQAVSLRLENETTARGRRRDELVKLLVRRKLTQRLAGSVADRAINFGHSAETQRPIYLGDREYAARTAYDLLFALGKEATRHHFSRRELLERVAYVLLTGAMKV